MVMSQREGMTKDVEEGPSDVAVSIIGYDAGQTKGPLDVKLAGGRDECEQEVNK